MPPMSEQQPPDRRTRLASPAKADQSESVRLQKFLASCGLGSRRACEELITSRRVTVDGAVAAELGTKVTPGVSDVRVDGERVASQKKRYFLLNKPEGYLCTNRDPSGRRRAVDLVRAGDTQLFTVGRLDETSEGLLLVTNDGDLAQKLAHPRFRMPRRYLVHCAGVPKPETVSELETGLRFAGGKFQVSKARRLKTQGQSTHLEVELHEGRNREIRRLFARVGHKVLKLRRISFGPLRLGELAVGSFRPLSRGEVADLHRWADGFRPEAKPRPAAKPRRAKRTVTSPRRVGPPTAKGKKSGKAKRMPSKSEPA